MALLCACAATVAQPGGAAADDALPAALDVQRRGVASRRFEVSPFVGNFIGDRLENALHVGARVEVRLLEGLALGADFGWSAITPDPDSPFGQVARGENLYAIQGMVLLPMPAALVIGGRAIVADLFGSLGGGVLRVGGFTRGDGFLGGGMKIFFGKLSWLGVRVEVRSYFSSLPTPAGAQFSADFAVMLGPTFTLPPAL
jgi:hypothetical protein